MRTAAHGTHRTPPTGRWRIARATCRLSWASIRVVILVAVVAFLVAWRVLGYQPLVVTSGSMAPAMPVWSLAFVQAVPAADVREGDVITFTPPGRGERVTHRVVERVLRNGQTSFVTQGDANRTPDDWRSAAQRADTGAATGEVRSRPDRGVSYGNGEANRVAWSAPHAGRLSMIGAIPWLRPALLGIPAALVLLRVLAWIWTPRSAAVPRRHTGDRHDHGSLSVSALGDERAA